MRSLYGGRSELSHQTEKGADTEYCQEGPAQHEQQHAGDPADHQSGPREAAWNGNSDLHQTQVSVVLAVNNVWR